MMTSAKARRSTRRRERARDTMWGYLFIAPLVVLFAGFTIWPVVASWVYAFFDWDGVGPPRDWVGVGNFTEAFASDEFWSAFTHSFLFSLGALFIELPLALMLAIVLNNAMLRGRTIYRLALFVPVVATTAVVGLVLAVLLSPVGGVVNEVIVTLGIVDRPVNFLGDPDTALATLIGIDIWKGFGITLIYWLAALQTVPNDLIEAAKVDGASAWRRFVNVVVPSISPIGIVIILLTFQRSLNTFDLVQAVTRGGPALSTDVIPTFIYRYAFDSEFAAPRYGFACAVGVAFGVFTLILTLLQGPLAANRMRRYAT